MENEVPEKTQSRIITRNGQVATGLPSAPDQVAQLKIGPETAIWIQ
jgi:hypothetical protein